MKISNEWQKYLGLAMRAGAVVYGADAIIDSRKKVYLVVMSDTLATQNLKDKIDNFIARKNTKLIKLDDDINKYLNTNNCKVFGITNEDLANQIYSFLNKEY